MNEKINADLESLKFIFNKNKIYLLPVAVILVSIILFFQFVIPQFGALFAATREAKESSLKLEALKQNLSMLANVDEDTLNSQLKILSSALPLSKDFIGILNSIYSTAQRTGVNLGSFSFAIGDLYKSENSDIFPVVKLSAPINSTVTAISSFAEAISKTLPLSEIYLVKAGSTSSTVGLSFYYMPLDSSNYSQDVRVSPVSQEGLKLINQLNGFTSSSAVQ